MLVDDQRRERLAFDVLGDDQQRTGPPARPPSSTGSSLADVRDLLVDEQDVRLVELGRSACPALLMKYGER
jgi:hypothetical protein